MKREVERARTEVNTEYFELPLESHQQTLHVRLLHPQAILFPSPLVAGWARRLGSLGCLTSWLVCWLTGGPGWLDGWLAGWLVG